MIDEKFGRLTVIEAAGSNAQHRRLWRCLCECGNELIARGDNLSGGKTKSCGKCDLVEVVPGAQFGRWTAIEDVGADKDRNRLWRCVCSCPDRNEGIIPASRLRKGTSQSCGCLAREIQSATAKRVMRKHGHRVSEDGKQSPVYTAWLNMKERCNNPNRPQYKDWGGRGIGYDPRWETFENFLEDMGEPPVGTSLDRIDNDGNYTKDNCRWATRDTQRRNSRQTHKITDTDGEVLVLKDFARKYGLRYGAIINRIHRGWSLEEAVELPLQRQGKKTMIEFDYHIASGESERTISDDLIEPTPTLRFNLSYPLRHEYAFEETHDNGRGWTQLEFVDAVSRAYEAVYAAEDAAADAEGPYGIWGHGIGDLFLEQAERLPDGTWDIWVGS